MNTNWRCGAALGIFGSAITLTSLACAVLIPPAGATAIPTPTGQIGAVEAATPGLKGDKKDFQIWLGTILSHTSRQFMSNGAVVNACTTSWDTHLEFAVDSVGNLAGTGTAKLSKPRSCTSGSNLLPNTTEFTLSIQGRKDSTAYYLKPAFTALSPLPSAEFGGYTLLFKDGTCPPKNQSIRVPLTGGRAAEAKLDLSGIMTGCGGSQDDIMSNQSQVTLLFGIKCSDVPPDENDPTLRQLCQ